MFWYYLLFLFSQIQYSLEEPSLLFSVSLRTGQIRLKNTVDYETIKQVSLKIIAQDEGRPSKQSRLTLDITIQDVNDNSPVFTKQDYSFELVDSTPISTRFSEVHADDDDSGSNAEIIYVLGSHLDVFGIVPTDGKIYTRMSLIEETGTVYDVRVIAADNGSPSRSSLTIVSITVQDGAYNRPVFTETEYR